MPDLIPVESGSIVLGEGTAAPPGLIVPVPGPVGGRGPRGWTVTDVSADGSGNLVFTLDDPGGTTVGPVEVPSLTAAASSASAAASSASDAQDAVDSFGLSASASTLAPGASATATVTGGPHYSLTLGVPEGKKGETGPKGDKGDTGSTGPKGDTGDTGSAGPKGDTGATGPANSLSIGTVTDGGSADATITGTAPSQTLDLTLPQGPKGDKGAAGAKGDTGSRGPKGDTGATGAKGDTGPKGDKGDPGTTSWSGITGKPSTFPPSPHTHTASQISDSTSTGRAVVTAASTSAARSAIGAGTSSLALGSTSSTAMRGDRTAADLGGVTGNYTIVVSTSEPGSGTPASTITFVKA